MSLWPMPFPLNPSEHAVADQALVTPMLMSHMCLQCPLQRSSAVTIICLGDFPDTPPFTIVHFITKASYITCKQMNTYVGSLQVMVYSRYADKCYLLKFIATPSMIMGSLNVLPQIFVDSPM